MIYPEYEFFRTHWAETNRRYIELLSEKAELFALTQPSGVNTEREAVSGGKQGNVYESYMIALESSKIDERIAAVKEILEEQERRLKDIEQELRKSLLLDDKVYRMRYIDRIRVYRIARMLNYSEPHIYRILRRIERTLKEDKK